MKYIDVLHKKADYYHKPSITAGRIIGGGALTSLLGGSIAGLSAEKGKRLKRILQGAALGFIPGAIGGAVYDYDDSKRKVEAYDTGRHIATTENEIINSLNSLRDNSLRNESNLSRRSSRNALDIEFLIDALKRKGVLPADYE